MRRLPPLLRWTRSSTVLLSAFFLVILLIIYVWWPLAEQAFSYIDGHGPWWLYLDWLLIGIFLFMSFTIVAHADLKRDALIIFVATLGGLVIEAWGTQTNLWFYYTRERPPLWIVPAWPIATLSIDRITRLLNWTLDRVIDRFHAPGHSSQSINHESLLTVLYWIVFTAFLAIMIPFVAPTVNKPSTILASLLCVLVIATANDHRRAVLVFAAGAGLGYFLELWGTTRECWTYYTYQTPPLFAVLAHGMAAVIFWRTGLLLQTVARRAQDMLQRQEPRGDPVNTDEPS
ncbi:MAG TPA: hypothetical protein VF784_16320 [Anaerolineales bacterium]